MKIYFSASVRGGIADISVYSDLISHLKRHGAVLTEHIADPKLHSLDPSHQNSVRIYKRDTGWLGDADVIIAEVSTPSHGQGYELRYAEEHKKPILCLYRRSDDRHLSAMIEGDDYFTVKEYTSLEEAKQHIDAFIGGLRKTAD